MRETKVCQICAKVIVIYRYFLLSTGTIEFSKRRKWLIYIELSF